MRPFAVMGRAVFWVLLMATWVEVVAANEAAVQARDPVGYALLKQFQALPSAPTRTPVVYNWNRGGTSSGGVAEPDRYAAQRASLYSQLDARGLIHHIKRDFGDTVSKALGTVVEVGVPIIVGVGLAYGGLVAGGVVGGTGGAAAATAGETAATTTAGVSASGLGGGSGAVGASTTLAGSGLGGTAVAGGGVLAPGVASVGTGTALASTAGGVWEGLATAKNAIVGGVKVAGDLASTKLIVDSLTGKTKAITNSETVPPGWVLQDSAPAAPASPESQAASIPWVPLLIVAAVLIGAR